jgi:hypothetical protein
VKDFATISGYARVCGFASVSEWACIADGAFVLESARVKGVARVLGHAQIRGEALVYGLAHVQGDAVVSGPLMRGKWDSSPLQMQIGRWLALFDGEDLIWGNRRCPLAYWQDHFQEIVDIAEGTQKEEALIQAMLVLAEDFK